MLLRLKDVRVHYGKAEAIQGITVDVEERSITGLIGAYGPVRAPSSKPYPACIR